MNSLVGKYGNPVDTLPSDPQSTSGQSCLEPGSSEPKPVIFPAGFSSNTRTLGTQAFGGCYWFFSSSLQLTGFSLQRLQGNPQYCDGAHSGESTLIHLLEPSWEALPQFSCLDLWENFMSWKSVLDSIYRVAVRLLYNLTIPNCPQLKFGTCVDNPRWNFLVENGWWFLILIYV